MKSLMKKTVVAGLLAALSLTAHGEPPAWVVTDEDSRIVLFPTVHALPEGLDWKSDALVEVIETSEEVWTEIGDPNDPSLADEIPQLIATYGLSPDTPLSARLTPEQASDLAEATATLGIPAASLDPMKPWLAALMMTQTELAAAGITGERGVESVLSGVFGDRPVRQLETAKQQTLMLAELDMETQIDFLMTAVETTGTAAERLQQITEDWAEGDVSGMDTELLAEMRADFPELYDIIFTDRNAAWTDILVEELAGSGTDFVAVGAGHLVGADSVPSMLTARGYDVQRVTLSDAEF